MKRRAYQLGEGKKMDLLIVLQQLDSHMEKGKIRFVPHKMHRNKFQIKNEFQIQKTKW